MKNLISLFLTMLKIGTFTFGGGYAMIALMENEFVTKKQYISYDEFMDVVAIAESTPGPIAINLATYIGYKRGGVLGSLAATIGMCIPSFTIIYLISLFFDAFLELKPVAAAFRGIQVGVIFIIMMAGVKMLSSIKKNAFNIAVISLTVVLSICFALFSVNFSAVFYILLSGLLGLVIYLIGYIKGGKAR